MRLLRNWNSRKVFSKKGRWALFLFQVVCLNCDLLDLFDFCDWVIVWTLIYLIYLISVVSYHVHQKNQINHSSDSDFVRISWFFGTWNVYSIGIVNDTRSQIESAFKKVFEDVLLEVSMSSLEPITTFNLKVSINYTLHGNTMWIKRWVLSSRKSEPTPNKTSHTLKLSFQ